MARHEISLCDFGGSPRITRSQQAGPFQDCDTGAAHCDKARHNHPASATVALSSLANSALSSLIRRLTSSLSLSPVVLVLRWRQPASPAAKSIQGAVFYGPQRFSCRTGGNAR
jgi:hypothetical protein